jgi:ammonium transporter Rh
MESKVENLTNNDKQEQSTHLAHHHKFRLHEHRGEPKKSISQTVKHAVSHRSMESWVFVSLSTILQIILLILIYVFVDYESFTYNPSTTSFAEADAEVNRYYKMEMDVVGMIFIGFAFLMTFLKKYGYSSFGFNMIISAFAFEWTVLCMGFFTTGIATDFQQKIQFNIQWILQGNFGAATVLISFGALLGKISPSQLIIAMVIEVFFYSLNYYICAVLLLAVDVGGSMYIHMFGAYFGLACSIFLTKYEARAGHRNQAPRYDSNLFSVIGTIFLWLFWPSFNAALANTSIEVLRCILNTFVSLIGSTISTFIISRLSRGHFEMEDIQNATLAGGVAMGAAANLILSIGGALTIGLIAGVVSTLGFKFLSPLLREYCFLHDTCGVHNLHALPGVIGGLACLIATGVARYKQNLYGSQFYKLIPQGAKQPGFQLAAMLITICLAVIPGAITGILLRWFFPPNEPFTDTEYWCIPDQEFPDDTLELPIEKAEVEIEMDTNTFENSRPNRLNQEITP